MPQHAFNGNLARTRTLRQFASAVLQKLLDDRACCEDVLSQRGRVDPIRTVTGRSSIDQAIADTRAMIDGLDRLLAEQGHAGAERGTAATGTSLENGHQLSFDIVTRAAGRAPVPGNGKSEPCVGTGTTARDSSCTMRREPVHFTV